MRLRLAAALLVTFFGTMAIAQAADKPNPSTTWKLSIEINGSPTEFALKLKLDGDKLTGAIIGEDGKENAIKDGKLKDGVVSFTVVHEQDGQTIPVKVTGKLSGVTMKGKADFEVDGQAQSLPWDAKLVAPAKPAAAKKEAPKKAAGGENPVGAWALTVDVNGSPYEFTMKLKGDAAKLSGTIAGDDGNENAFQDVKYKDGTLSFTVIREQNGEKMPLKNTAKLTGNTMKGKAEFTMDGDAQSLSWEAKRVVEKAAAEKPAAEKPAEAKKPAATASPAGKWNLTIDVNGSTHELTLTLKADGDKLSGSIAGENGEEHALQDLKFKDGDLSFTIVREQNGEKMPLKATAKLAGDTLKGKTEFKLDGEDHSLPWEAKRAK